MAIRITVIFMKNVTFSEMSNKLFKKSYDVIHIASHGYHDKSNPLKSGIIAFNHKIKKHKNVFTFYDMTDKKINTNMLIINSCELGKNMLQYTVKQGSIANLLSEAGVNSVVAPLWEIDDKSSKIMMMKLYYNITKGMQVEDALRYAQLYMIENSTYTDDPFAWAPYIYFKLK